MYFWRIEALKAKMVERPLYDKEVLPYLLMWIALTVVFDGITPKNASCYDWVTWAFAIIAAVGGTIWAYKWNGGADGEHFLQRYFALGWVVSIRWLAGLAVALIAVLGFVFALFVCIQLVTGCMPKIVGGQFMWFWCAFLMGALVFYYWRLAHHVRDVAQRTKSTNETPQV